MTWEQASFLVSLAVLALQGVSLYTAAKLKVWALEKFVSKSDFLETLHMWSKGESKKGA